MTETKTLIKIDRNGSKHYEGMVTCDRCGGRGGSDAWEYTGYTCYKCGGTGRVYKKWIERTPEYQAKLDAKRLARLEKEIAKNEELRKEREAREETRRLAEEQEKARIREQKAKSQHVGNVGEKLDIEATYDHRAYYTAHIGWMEQTIYIHTFRDIDGNALIWKTSSTSLVGIVDGDKVKLRGTIKEHSEYNDEKQTALTRCKVEKISDEG
ncbi:MAG: hypothetical protein IKH82_03750 [Clostridiales bacterium]|nr:hypothetical protein [Ruminococcus sp.]MBR6987163.1 hypothetical protein [Clostridiales bacterium]